MCYITAGGTIWNPPALSDQQQSSKTKPTSMSRRKSIQDENQILPSSPSKQQPQATSSQTSETNKKDDNNINDDDSETIAENLRKNNKKYNDIMKRIEKFTEIINKSQQATTPKDTTHENEDDSSVEGDYERNDLIGCDYCVLDCDHECSMTNK